jgi:Fe-S-cluster containining protein
LPYDPGCIQEIASYLNLTVKQVIEKYYGKLAEDSMSLEFEEHKRKPCPFLETDKTGITSCRIYPVRPLGCRLYPFGSMGGFDCPQARAIYKKLRKEEI